MHYTALATPPASQSSREEPPTELKITLKELKTAFERLHDPRKGPNLHYPLAVMLLAATVAILCNQLNELAIAEWLADLPRELQAQLGFSDGRTPHQTTFNRVFQNLKAESLENSLISCFEAVGATSPQPQRGEQAVAIDGKAQRTRAKFEKAQSKGTPCHLLSLFVHHLGIVLAQTAIENKAAELTVAPSLLGQINWLGRVLTGDAIFCQRNLCQLVQEAGGDYFFCVKANQPNLKSDIEAIFAAPTTQELDRVGFEAPAPLVVQEATMVDKGHGRLEIREIKASSELADYSDWPGLSQVFEIRRRWLEKEVWKEETHLGVTSLPISLATVQKLLAYKRGHWGIENKLHWVRDVVFGEDKSTLHKGNGPQILAALRNIVLNLLRLAGYNAITATLRSNSRQPARALALLGFTDLNA